MVENRKSNESHLFLVRLWLDVRDSGDSLWHGKLQHLTTGKAAVFDGKASLVELLISMVPGIDSSDSPNARHQDEMIKEN